MKRAAALLIAALAIALAATYLIRQGAFDPPLVRVARLITQNDAAAVTAARRIARGDATAALAEASDWLAQEHHESTNTAFVAYITDLYSTYSSDFSNAIYTDWNTDSAGLTPALDRMLEANGISERPDMDRLRADEEEYGPVHGNVPVIKLHYQQIFARNGVSLMELDAG